MARLICLRPNWDEHDATTCSIINYFADRNNTALITTNQEKKQKRAATFVAWAKTVTDLKDAEQNLKKWVFEHLTKT